MIANIKPLAAEIDAAVNVLSVLEMAKDASKIKATLQGVKEAQQEAARERAAAEKAIVDLCKERAQLDDQRKDLDAQAAKVREESARAFKNAEDVELSRVAMRNERDRFDKWMADQREALNAQIAKVQSDAVANERRHAELQEAKADAATRAAEAVAAIKAADARRAEYENKLSSLKAMVG